MMKRISANIALCLLSLVGGPASAQTLYKWVDEQGVVHYTSTVPPAAAKHDREILTDQGTTVGKIRGEMTPEEKAEEERRQAEIAAQKKAEAEARKRDRNLLITYKSEEEIERARDNKLAFLDEMIGTLQERLTEMQAYRQQLLDEAAEVERSGKRVAEELKADIRTSEQRIEDYDHRLKKSQAEKDRTSEEFDADIKRFRELKGLTSDQ